MKKRPPPPPAPDWAARLETAGVTGTNGKTTTTSLIAAALRRVARPVPLITTLGEFLDEERQQVPFGHAGFIETMRRALDAGGRLAAIELTSEALMVGFARAWPCRVGVFTNLTRDHMDAHGSAEHYLASKAQLFVALPPGGVAVLNACDAAGELLAEVVPAHASVLRYGVASRGAPWAEPHLDAEEVSVDWTGTRVRLRWRRDAWPPPGPGEDLPAVLSMRAIGEVFAENGLAALLGAMAMGVPATLAAAAIAEAPAPPGRFQVVAERPRVVVDYAHTPDALSRTVDTARRLAGDAGKVVLVFGAGGNRDREKRPSMGEAARGADVVWITSDNPRDEDPAAIADAIASGLAGHEDTRRELDRARAIERAVGQAADGDVLVIAGKGHEGVQIGPGGESQPFSDVEVARAATRRERRS